MNKIIAFIATAAAFSVSNLFAATDYVIQITEKDGTVHEIPVSNLEKISFETSSTTIDVNDPTKAFEERFGTEKIHATQYRIPAKTAEKMVKEYHAKGNNHKHNI